jgi:hypothetical protein
MFRVPLTPLINAPHAQLSLKSCTCFYSPGAEVRWLEENRYDPHFQWFTIYVTSVLPIWAKIFSYVTVHAI